MDMLIVMVLGAIVWLLPKKAPTVEVEGIPTIELNPTLNPDFYHDEQAFMVIANELGFY